MAIEPIKGFYVHDEETDTDGVAKVSIDAVHEFVEDVSGTVENWLDEHPEATTTVQDDSLTTAKYKDGSVTLSKIKKGDLGYVTPEMFGAVGDGVADDTEAIQDAIATGKDVLFISPYLVSNKLELMTTSKLIFTSNGILKFTGSGACLYALNGRRIIIDHPRILSENRTGIGILLEKARNCEIINPRIQDTDTAIKIDGLDEWSASNIIYDPFLYKFNKGIHLTANEGHQTNDTKVIGGYIIDVDGSSAIGVHNDASCDTNVFFGVAVEDCGTSFYNTSPVSIPPMSLIGCRSENATNYHLRSTASCQNLHTYACNFTANDNKVSVSAPWNQDLDGQNITKAFLGGADTANRILYFYDYGNNRRSFLGVLNDGIMFGPANGTNYKTKIRGTNASQMPSTYIEAGGANGLLFRQAGFIMKSSTNGSSKYFKITVDDNGEISATETSIS